jgi:hypothetical protein
VPLGACFAICIAMLFVMVAHWNRVAAVTADDDSGLTTFLVLIPMLLRLTGRWAWYLPRWAHRMLPVVRFGHAWRIEPS